MTLVSRATVSFYVRIATAFALPCTLLEILIISLDSRHGSWPSVLGQSAVMGVALGMGFASIVTSTARKGLAGAELNPADIEWFPKGQWTEVELPFGLVESRDLVEQELRSRHDLSVAGLDRSADGFTARTDGGWKAMTDVMKVSLVAVGEPDAATTRARIESRPCMRVKLLEVGTSKRLVESIARSLNQAVNRRLKAEREAAEQAALQAQLHQARLGLLQAQVEPHFLYNTLANLQLLIRDDARAAEKMTGDLIQYLRLSVPDFRGGEFTLGREIDLVRAYADIMKIRMRDRLQVDIAVDDAAAAHAFAPLLLHTLVENAIKHGLEPRPEGGRISIEARSLADGGLRITVADTGMGLQEGSHGSGMGLVNLRERLNLLYGERARLSIEPNTPSGIVCVIEIPAAQARAA
jgi:signal transduction histidine kinase